MVHTPVVSFILYISININPYQQYFVNALSCRSFHWNSVTRVRSFRSVQRWGLLISPWKLHENWFQSLLPISAAVIRDSGCHGRRGTANVTWGPFYWHDLTLIPVWIGNHMPSKVWDEIIFPFPNSNCCTVEVWKWISNFTHALYWMRLLIHAGVKVIWVSKMGHCTQNALAYSTELKKTQNFNPSGADTRMF